MDFFVGLILGLIIGFIDGIFVQLILGGKNEKSR